MLIQVRISYIITLLLFVIFLFLQVGFWKKYEHVKPDMIIVPEVPSKLMVQALSLGDEQFYFRYLGLKIQNAGDSWGRFTALRDYNYADLLKWFMLLDILDHKSNYIPSLAAYYYAQTQNSDDTIYVVEYLRNHYKYNPALKWWWLSQAVYIAQHKLKNSDLALELAYEMHNLPNYIDMPLWAREMAAFIHEKRGEEESAKDIIANIIYHQKDFSIGELNFMEYFISDRLKNEKFKEELAERFLELRNAIPEEERRAFEAGRPKK